jgi:phage gpG-like protein
MARPDDLLSALVGLQLRGMRTSPVVAAAMADTFHDHLVNVTLKRYEHPMYTRTAAPPGGPVGSVSGELAYSVTSEVRSGVLTSRAWVGPHTIYAGVQEFGAEIDVKHVTTDRWGHTIPGFMRWYMEGEFWYKRHVSIPSRPYMEVARNEVIADGSLHRAAVRAFLEVEET